MDYSINPRETPAQSAPDYVLNPLTIFRMARKSILERHAPERADTTSVPKVKSAVDIHHSPCEVVGDTGVEDGHPELEVD